MFLAGNRIYRITVMAAILGLLTSCGFHRKKYENPITKDTQQPDKVLFDKAINDIEHGRYEVARLTLNTMINTYDTSEFLAKAKLAIADSWYREGGSHAWAQAEAEYKDFKLFYPTMEEAAESQEKVCLIHFKQMEKPDRDREQAIRAEDECRQLLVEYPNSKFAPQAQQMLRDIQEVLAEGEFRAGMFYHTKGGRGYVAAANRLQAMADQYPLFSHADEALWELADSYKHMGDRFEDKAAAALTRIVKDYPLSSRVEEATKELQAMNRPVPQSDPVAYARMKYELENRQKEGMMSHALGIFKHSPDTRAAAKSGTPAMAANRPTIPLSVPAAATPTTGTSDVSVQTVTDSTALDTKPDARQNPPAAGGQPAGDGAAAKAADAPASASSQPAPASRSQKKKKSKKKNETPPAETQPSDTQPNETQPKSPPQ